MDVSRNVDQKVDEAISLLVQAQSILDSLPDFDLASAHLQQAIDDLQGHQSRQPPRD